MLNRRGVKLFSVILHGWTLKGLTPGSGILASQHSCTEEKVFTIFII